MKFFPKIHCLGCTNIQKHSLASQAKGVGVAGSNIHADLSGTDLVLHAKFQPWGSNGVAAYSVQTQTVKLILWMLMSVGTEGDKKLSDNLYCMTIMSSFQKNLNANSFFSGCFKFLVFIIFLGKGGQHQVIYSDWWDASNHQQVEQFVELSIWYECLK